MYFICMSSAFVSVFFFSSRRRHTRSLCDWSSDVCSSDLLVESPTYEVSNMGQVPYVDVAGTLSAQDGKVAIFALNRDLSKSRVVEIDWQDRIPRSEEHTSELQSHSDLVCRLLLEKKKEKKKLVTIYELIV